MSKRREQNPKYDGRNQHVLTETAAAAPDIPRSATIYPIVKESARRQTLEERRASEQQRLSAAAADLLRAAGVSERAHIKPELTVEIGNSAVTVTMSGLGTGVTRTLFGAPENAGRGLSRRATGFGSLNIINVGRISYTNDTQENDDRVPIILATENRVAKKRLRQGGLAPRENKPALATGTIKATVNLKVSQASFILQKIVAEGQGKTTYDLTLSAYSVASLVTILDFATKGTQLMTESQEKKRGRSQAE